MSLELLLQRWRWPWERCEEHGLYTEYWLNASSAIVLYEGSLDFPDALSFFTHQVDEGKFQPAHRQILMFIARTTLESDGPWQLFHLSCQDLGQLGMRFLNSYAEVAHCDACQAYRVYTREEPVSGQPLHRTKCSECSKRSCTD